MRIDPAMREIERSKIRDMAEKLSRHRINTTLLREYDVSLFKWLSDFPVLYLPPEIVQEWGSRPITGRDLWVYEHRYWFTHSDDEGDYWTEPGHELIEGRDTYLDGTTCMSEVPRYSSLYEDALRFKMRILSVDDILLWLREIPDREDVCWQAVIVDRQGKQLASGEADGSAQAIVLAVMNFMLEHPHLVWTVRIVD